MIDPESTMPIKILVTSAKEHGFHVAGTGFTWFAVIAANQEKIEAWLRTASYLGAIGVSLLTMWSIWKKNK